jgi:hypothetical protein
MTCGRESINHNSGWQREFSSFRTQKVCDAKIGSIRRLLYFPAEIFWKKQFERMTQMWWPWQKDYPIVLIFMAIDNKSHRSFRSDYDIAEQTNKPKKCN